MVLRKEYYEELNLVKKKPSEVTNVDMFQKVWHFISKISELEDALKTVYYAHPADYSMKYVASIAESCMVRALVQTGGNEGVLIDYYIESTDNKVPSIVRLGTIKTLGEDIDACIQMGMISGALVRAGELFLFYNY